MKNYNLTQPKNYYDYESYKIEASTCDSYELME